MTTTRRQSQQHAQKQLLKIAPQQIQFLNLLQLASIELDQRVKDELEENPLLEDLPAGERESEPVETPENDPETSEPSDDPNPDRYDGDEAHDPFEEAFSRLHDANEGADAYDGYTGPDDDADRPERTPVQTQTFRENLREQLLLLPLDRQTAGLATYIVDALDDDGYLRRPLADMADDISFSINLFIEEPELEAALSVVQQLEPAGVGARELAECLLLQLDRRLGAEETPASAAARRLIRHHLPDLAAHQYEKIVRATGLEPETVRAAVDLITHLDPKPIAALESSPLPAAGNADRIMPEFQITLREGKLEVELLNQRSYRLQLNHRLLDMLDAAEKAPNPDREKKAVAQYLRGKLGAAQWFIDALRQREDTLTRTIRAIAQMQGDFFSTGDTRRLRPMILKDIAERVGLDVSTISRVTSSRYVQTDFGIISLKELFTEGLLRSDGAVISNREVQDMLRTLVDQEDKSNPLTDQQLADLLAAEGSPIARRTVTKYRELLGIQPAQQRRTWADTP